MDFYVCVCTCTVLQASLQTSRQRAFFALIVTNCQHVWNTRSTTRNITLIHYTYYKVVLTSLIQS